MEYTFTQLLSFFFIYAFLGWCTEVIFVTVDTGKAVNRGFLNGPVCPIYGVGVVLVVGLLKPISGSWILLYICSVLLTSVLEFVTGFILEKFFHEKWWDYTGIPFNIKGYVCLKFSLLWGIGCMVVVKTVHPLIESFIAWLPGTLTVILLAVLSAVFITDMVITLIGILGLPKRLKAITEAEAALTKIGDELSASLSKSTVTIRETGDDITFGIKEKSGEIAAGLKETGDGIKTAAGSLRTAADEKSAELIDSLKKKKAELTARIEELTAKEDKGLSGSVYRRLLKAFPQLGGGRYKNAFEQMRELLKKNGK